MSAAPLGFVGLGNMGGPMAANIAKAGIDLIVYDQAGSAARAPAGSTPVDSLAAVAKRARSIFLSVPDGAATLAIATEIASLRERATQVLIDLSTIGVESARQAHQRCAAADLTYIDAPVSGGQAGAKAATITVMWAGPKSLLAEHQPALQAMAKNIFHVGDRAGQGQALKLLNNFLSATALLATSEAVLFGLAQGLDFKTLLDVVNVSTGRNSATADKFPNRILTGTYDAGFHTTLMAKDVKLYLESAAASGTPHDVGALVGKIWQAARDALPGSDFTEIFKFLRSHQSRAEGNP
ncbi:MAG: NAD(P)-dependent oxidoreductase [Gammaproteobacteria bacterium]